LKDFTGALKFLRQVPEDTPAYAKVPEKILEYTEKQRLKGATGKAKPSTAKAPSKRPFRLEPFTNNSFSNQSSFDELFPGRVPSSPQRLDPGSRLQEVVPQTPVVPRRVYSTNGE
jgi:hypothetical protein